MTNKTYLAHRRAYAAKENVKPYALTTWIILIALFIGLASVKAQSDSLVWGEPISIYKGEYYKISPLHDSIAKKQRLFIRTVTDDGSAVQIRTADTIPVVMMVSDTTIERNSGLKDSGVFVFSLKECPFYTIYGYEVTTIVPILFESGQRFYPGMPTTEKKTIYLNHKKQPLPDRIIVWMAIRRNEK